MKVPFYDVIIAGAGPAGLYAAHRCEKLGLSVLVLEEHAVIGEPVHCSGLVSSNLKRFLSIKEEFVENRVKGAIMHSPNGKKLKLDKKGIAAYVIDRGKLDKHIASMVSSDIITKSRIDAFTVMDDRVMVKSGRRVFESSVLLGCDGSNSFVRRQMNVKPKATTNGLIAIIDKKDDSSYVEMWFDKNWTDGFFWKIPRGRSVEYGMIGTGAKFSHLEKFFELTGKYKKRAGMIPLGPPKTYFDRVLLVGDAGAQVKPWSGGGVIYSLVSANIAASVIVSAKKANDFTEKFLKKYEDVWRKEFGGKIRTGMIGRKLFAKMNNSQLDLAAAGANRMRFLLKKLDMDFLVK